MGKYRSKTTTKGGIRNLMRYIFLTNWTRKATFRWLSLSRNFPQRRDTGHIRIQVTVGTFQIFLGFLYQYEKYEMTLQIECLLFKIAYLFHGSSPLRLSAKYCLCRRCLQNSKNSISRVKFFRTISLVDSKTGGLQIFRLILEYKWTSSVIIRKENH